jgi:RHS repeat-associated protein
LRTFRCPYNKISRNNYQYNYKEWNDDLGLYLNDYGFRYFNPQLNQWHSIDPLAEDYYALSSYTYVANNPIKYTDPDGRWINELEADPSEAMYELMAEDGGDPDCPECDQVSIIHFSQGDLTIFGDLPTCPTDDEATEFERRTKAMIERTVDNVATGQDGITHDNTLVELFFGPEDLALMGAMKVFAVVPFIIKANGKIVKIRNGALAGKLHPKTGVPFDAKGFPDFSAHLYKGGANDVIITPTGNKIKDFAAANAKAGYTNGTPKGYTWHHHQDNGRMQLVDYYIHRDTGHTGGFSLW